MCPQPNACRRKSPQHMTFTAQWFETNAAGSVFFESLHGGAHLAG